MPAGGVGRFHRLWPSLQAPARRGRLCRLRRRQGPRPARAQSRQLVALRGRLLAGSLRVGRLPAARGARVLGLPLPARGLRRLVVDAVHVERHERAFRLRWPHGTVTATLLQQCQRPLAGAEAAMPCLLRARLACHPTSHKPTPHRLQPHVTQPYAVPTALGRPASPAGPSHTTLVTQPYAVPTAPAPPRRAAIERQSPKGTPGHVREGSRGNRVGIGR